MARRPGDLDPHHFLTPMPDTRTTGFEDRTSAVYETSSIRTRDESRVSRDGEPEELLDRYGTVRTWHGLVDVYSCGYWRRSGGWRSRHTILRMTLRGTTYERRWDDRVFSARFLATLAKDFAAHVAAIADPQ